MWTMPMSGLPGSLRTFLTAAFLVVLGAPPAFAQDGQMMRDKMIQWGDYDQFQVAGPGGPRSCAETCANDPRCKAWTFIRPVNQCRLKHDVGQIVDNGCCVSGIKPEERVTETGGKQRFCADYARKALDANMRNERQGCGLHGGRWSDDFQTHYSWCMGVHRDESSTEASARETGLAQCQQSADEGADAKCDHFARVSMVQVETALKAHCPLPPGDPRWANNADVHRRACRQAPTRVLAGDIAAREAVLSTCLVAAGQAQEACAAYADKAVEQVHAAANSGCEVTGPNWSTARAQHLQWCLGADPGARRAQSEDRDRQLTICTQQAAKRQACDRYAEAAMGQAMRNGNENCGQDGPNWSRYKDEHVAFCMQAGDADLRAANADRDTALRRCKSRAAVNPECDDFATRAVKFGQINQDRNCGLDGDAWTADYAAQYQFCVRSNPMERRLRMFQRRAALFACSTDHGFKLELGF